MKRGKKILIIGGIMELFVLSSIVSYHLFLSHAPYSVFLDALGSIVHPIMFGGIAVLVLGAVIFFKDRK